MGTAFGDGFNNLAIPISFCWEPLVRDAIYAPTRIHCGDDLRENFSPFVCPLRRIFFFFFALASFAVLASPAAARVQGVAVPQELKSYEYTVEANGKSIDVAHAAASYDYINIEATTGFHLSITANEDGFWDRGVNVEPWRLGIRPTRTGRAGRTIEFDIKDSVKLAISRPDDFLNHARMLFVFVSKPAEAPTKQAASAPGFHLVEPGIHKGSINPKSNETWFLSPGAVIQGSINLFKVQNVKILGHGVVLYNGPQNPEDDDGWMQKPDWHCIGSDDAHHIEIDGVTCLVRSRTWSVQMKNSTHLLYNDLRVIGGNPGNANQDGMDWLGGGDTIVRDSFFRASDDVFALQGNWDGYGHAAMVRPGQDVSNITIENSVLSTSISNIVRVGWPEKIFNSHNFTLRNSDILAGGIGSCGLPFALLTVWNANGAKGVHDGFTFENLWLDNWYSLFQIEQEQPGLRGVTFRNIWALEQPPLVSSRLKGQIQGVHLENVKYGQAEVTSIQNLPALVTDGAQQPTFVKPDNSVRAAFRVSPAFLEPGTRAIFTADNSTNPKVKYTWLFGDGTSTTGQEARHAFPDALGTQLNGAAANSKTGPSTGRFRVILHADDGHGHEDWAAQNIVVIGRWNNAANDVSGKGATAQGLAYNIYPGTWPELPNFKTETSARNGVAPRLGVTDAGGFTRYAVAYEGLIEAPTDGGYLFHLLSRDGARLFIDGELVAQTGPPFGEVCGSPINAVRDALGSIGLRAGKHDLRLESLQTMSPASPRLQWSGPGISLVDVPPSAFSHRTAATLHANNPTHISTAGPNTAAAAASTPHH
jgi:hypothetical protein